MSNYNPETTAGRRGLIIKLVDEHGQVNVNELSEQFGVSEVTIRNDLAHLEQKNLLIRARGGAIKTEKASLDLRFLEKKSKHVREKEAIGRKAARYIDDGDTIVVDSGTTTREIANHQDRKSTRLNSSHVRISYAVFCLKKKNAHHPLQQPLHQTPNFPLFRPPRPLALAHPPSRIMLPLTPVLIIARRWSSICTRVFSAA